MTSDPLGHEDVTTVREYVKIAARDAREMYRSPLDALWRCAPVLAVLRGFDGHQEVHQNGWSGRGPHLQIAARWDVGDAVQYLLAMKV